MTSSPSLFPLLHDHDRQQTCSSITGDVTFDKVIDKMSKVPAGPSRKPKKEVTMADFEKVLDTTPLFMRETPKNGVGGENEVLEALRSLVFEGEGDGELAPSVPGYH